MAKILNIVESETITKNEEEMTRYIFSDDKIVYVRAKNDEVLPKTTPDKYIDLINVYNASQKAKTEKKPNYKGIDGWLLFLIVVTFIRATADFIGALIAISSYSAASAAGGIVYLGISALYFVTGAFMLCEKRSAKVLFTIVCSFSALVAFISSAASAPSYYQGVYILGSLIGAAIYPAIWIPYIWTSKRVKATLIK